MKAIGVVFTTLQMGNTAKPNLVISVDDAGAISMKSKSTFKTTEITFKLNEEFDETTAGGRKTKTVITLGNGKFQQIQSWNGKRMTLEQEIQDGKLAALTCPDLDPSQTLQPSHDWWLTVPSRSDVFLALSQQ